MKYTVQNISSLNTFNRIVVLNSHIWSYGANLFSITASLTVVLAVIQLYDFMVTAQLKGLGHGSHFI